MMKHQDSFEDEALRPRRGFLVASAVASVAAIAAYLYRDDIIGADGHNEIAFAFLIGMLILIAMYLLLCFRVPRIGNRLLGYDVMLKPEKKKEKASMEYVGSFKVQAGLAEKRQNTNRKQARYSRRKLAEVTRQMQAEKKAGAETSTAEPSSEKTTKDE
ncbi:hypothetical protein [Kordiimonas marina]|uniref:hypothetical protein n=1 Tax=Kordiimonas marina TaxID=2872312 RepID=UPI001FF4D62A|nr:hypothetical protein [Kordiimonas marina]MCJ9429264.1 hypothetical protein [Kordiimonas marina]